jgi:nitroreductase
MDAMECLRNRRSVRSFTKAPVAREDIEAVVDAGRLASTAMNLQPWHFVVVTNPETRSKLADITDHGKFIADAPVCIVVLSEDCKYYLEDCSAATQNILNAAHALGLGACWIAGDKKPYADKIAQVVGAPEGVKLVSLIALGYPAEVPQPKKKSLAEVIHWERF